MAITTTTIGINTSNVGTWTYGEVITQFEKAFEWLGWHGETRSGLCVGISTFSGGGTVSGNSEAFEDVYPISTSGIGTGASFYVERSSGPITEIHVNRPGYGYTGGETLTLSAEDIGGSGNGATNIELKVAVAGTIANGVGYAITFTGLYNASGTDRNGVVSGQATTITIKEGDTLTFTNNQTSSGYEINIIWNGDNTTSAANTNRVFNVSGQNNDNISGGETTWTPLPGQAGTYFVRENSSGFSASTPIIIVQPADPGDITYTGVGSTSTFYEIDTTDPDPYAVLRHTIQPNKKYGDTYRTIFFRNEDTDGRIYFASGSGYFPNWYSSSTSYSGGHGYGKRFAGARYLDLSRSDIFSPDVSPEYADSLYNDAQNYHGSSYIMKVGTDTAYQLDLNIFRSSLDPKFAVFSFKYPTKSSSHISGNTYSTFFFHNFTTDLWDLDELFLGGLTEIFSDGDGNATTPYITFRTRLGGMQRYNSVLYYSGGISKRTAEFGYAPHESDDADGNSVSGASIAFSNYYSLTYPNYQFSSSNRIYYRNSNIPVRTKGGANELTGNASISSNADFNAVVKGIPINSTFVPCPYYIPDDFVLIDFDYGTPSANIQQGDTITISGSEVYTVITGSYNNTNANRTRGILFCARTV